MGRELRRVPLNYTGFTDPRNKWTHRGETCRPPKGVGYQLWQTTSEPSPVSPVFRTLRELCEFAADNVSTFGTLMATADQWECMLSEYGFTVTPIGRGAVVI
jgi:hypothetical protein